MRESGLRGSGNFRDHWCQVPWRPDVGGQVLRHHRVSPCYGVRPDTDTGQYVSSPTYPDVLA